MKIFAVSDIHSFYTPMQKALDEAGFESGNENHLLVVCGDCFDRGDESEQVLEFLDNTPNKVLVRGNHEDLLEECIDRCEPWSHDLSNGTVKTIYDLGGANKLRTFEECCNVTWARVKPLLDKMVDYYETEHYIFVHGWIPCVTEYMPAWYRRGRHYEFDPNWRNGDWKQARWFNGMELAELWNVKQPGKTIVCGHWNTSYGHSVLEGKCTEFGEDADFSTYRSKGIIAIDACTAYSGKVNVIVLED